MARKKVKLAWIANDSARKATFKKRRKGLMKKVNELSVLCDVKACAVVYGPSEAQPEVWPSAAEATRVLSRFKSVPEMEKSKKMLNQEGFLRQRVAKLQEQLQKAEKESRELETRLLLYKGLHGKDVYNIGIEGVTCLAWMVEVKAKAVQERIERRMVAAAARVEEKATVTPAVAAAGSFEEMQAQEWLMKVMNPHEGVEGLMQNYVVDHCDPFLESLLSN